MKTISLVLFLTVIMNVQGQGILNRINKSNFFSDGSKVFYVLSNKFNSSGFLGETILDSIQITTDYGEMFDNKAIIISQELFLEKYNKNRPYNTMSIAIEMPDVSLKEFKIIGKNHGGFNDLIFYKSFKIDTVDKNSFKLISHSSSYSKDKNQVYFKERVVAKADPKTFKKIKNDFYKDANHVYIRGHIIINADPKSFQVISYMYQKDNNTVFVMSKPTNIDVNTFKVLTKIYSNKEQFSLYAIDKNHVYFQGKIIVKADPKTFKVVEKKTSEKDYDAYDKNYYFHFGNAKTPTKR